MLRDLWKDMKSYDRRALVILTWTPIALTLDEYLFTVPRSINTFAWLQGNLLPQLWWVAGVLLCTVLIPTLLLGRIGIIPRELGLRVRGTGHEAWTYVILYLVMLPALWIAAHRPGFRNFYPLFSSPSGPFSTEFLLFEVAYALQFFAVEYFFRGVLVLGLKPLLGRASVLVMLAPYCMIHYHKPLPEALGAIGAGLILGTLSWRTGTILYGWALHYAIALTMDLLALFN